MSKEHRTRKRQVVEDPSDVWEDVEVESDTDTELSQGEILEETVSRNTSRTRTPTQSVSSLRVSPRRRQFKVGAPTPAPRKAPARPPPEKIAVSSEHMHQGVLFLLFYVFDVLKLAIRLLRIPLSILVFLWMYAFILHRISITLRAAFSPLCYIPGISSSTFCLPDGYATPGGDSRSPRWADFPTLVDVQSATIEQLLDESSSGSMLSLKIKKAEMATTDLVTLVRVSDLKSRDTLGDTLRSFVDEARVTGRALSRLNSRVAGAVDGVMAVNDYALKTIESAQNMPPPSMLAQLIPWAPKPKTDIVVSAFEDSMNYLSTTMKGLVVEFELNLQNLNKLEEQLSVIHELVSREDNFISSAVSDLLAELWTKLGGNRRKLRGYENHLQLLKGLSEYRKQALVHVVSALQTLTQMSEDIENLRERVAAPELAGSRIPVEVHIRSIQNGLDRVKEGRLKAKIREDEALKKIGSD
ncbi:hypothetical protein R3P38DRAFT_2935039 [Favolaschia claudopus]|uniref:Uncharacterized protein n=1 Tax=Favolaschia claudopus TaxID=2862362 RepID=A0AAW0BR56_9AGAR